MVDIINSRDRPSEQGDRTDTALRATGKPAKVAIVAVMRKLIEIANALVKADRFWVQKNA
jgi:transposase